MVIVVGHQPTWLAPPLAYGNSKLFHGRLRSEKRYIRTVLCEEVEIQNLPVVVGPGFQSLCSPSLVRPNNCPPCIMGSPERSLRTYKDESEHEDSLFGPLQVDAYYQYGSHPALTVPRLGS